MGCWNTTCGISGLPIYAGEDVVVFLLTQNRFEFMENFVGIDTYFEPCLLPFYGQYNDYGDVEDCYGIALPVLIEALREKMVEMEEGENCYHDIPAKREELDPDKLFELDHEDRLFIKYNGSNLKTVHVQIKKSIFAFILDNYTIHTYDKAYKRIKHSFKDVEKDLIDNLQFPEGDNWAWMVRERLEEDLLARSVLYEQLGSPLYSIFRDCVRSRNKDLLLEMLKGAYINCFMDDIRKPWIKQIGNGSQDNDHAPYKLLMKGMQQVMKKERDDV